MIIRPRLLLALGLAALIATAQAADSGFKDIFNGKDLTGWKGVEGRWTVRDGAITGQTTAENPLRANTFLVYQNAQPANFELRISFKLVPNNDRNQANSGVQVRSKVLDDATFSVGGYQADIDSTGRYAGMLYEEKGRGIIMNPGERIRITGHTKQPNGSNKATIEKLPGGSTREEVLAAYKIGEWNDLVIIAKGTHLQQFLNGKQTAELFDEDSELAAKSGVIALQLHTGPPMTIQFKNIQLKTLP